ncbi:MAG: T9SS type A sorting domain-containing protein, partial [Ignavibacteria bacterium]
YNARFDQILMSVRGNSEAWIIDHSTTTQQAAGHTGGRYNKGGDLLYRWGNPACYKLGNSSNQKFFEQHDAQWIDSLYPGYGGITVFNNGVNRNYSTVDQFTPPVDSLGFYYRAPNTAFGPSALSWTFVATPPSSMYATDISGAQRLPNGNTLICYGTLGNFWEVTSGGQLVWKYVNPVINTGPLYYDDSIPHDPARLTETMNSEFRVQRYAPTYSGFTGRDMTPGNLIELYHTGVEETGNGIPNSFNLYQNYPNPFNPETNIKFDIPKSGLVKISVFDILGREIETLVNEKLNAGSYKSNWNASRYTSGVYFCRIQAEDYSKSIRMLLIK